ncbi:MAG: hypothetical protein M3Z84_02280 [Actinomycetota bacterium]|nr:hypothetical protein [Actinomycetota bacterium]
MMSPEITFFFYLAAVACFAIAALAGAVPAGVISRVGLVPLGLALFVFPTLWNTGKVAF